MQTSDFDYYLPSELIAQTPAEPRDSSRLMVVHRSSATIEHRHFRDIGDYLRPADLLVANNSRVIPARIFGRKTTGGSIEILLLSQKNELSWTALVKGKRTRAGTEINIHDRQSEPTPITATVLAELSGAERLIQFSEPIEPSLQEIGHTPLPPYIRNQSADPERYQTIYSNPEGSAAAPTAGLHFSPDLMLSLREKRVQFETATLHVGLDTFQPVKSETVEKHEIHSEWVDLSVNSAERINKSKLAGSRLVAVGTTSVRVLETAALRSMGVMESLQTIVPRLSSLDACPWKPVAAYTGPTDLFIYPGYQFQVVDALITNFHLPQSSLLMLVGAFASTELMHHAYETAIAEQYRFFSFGDAMLIL